MDAHAPSRQMIERLRGKIRSVELPSPPEEHFGQGTQTGSRDTNEMSPAGRWKGILCSARLPDGPRANAFMGREEGCRLLLSTRWWQNRQCFGLLHSRTFLQEDLSSSPGDNTCPVA